MSSWIGASFNTRITLPSISPVKPQAGECLPFKSKHKAGSSSKDATVNLISQNICRNKDCGHMLKPCRPTSKQICYQKCISTQSLFLKLYHERETPHPAQPILLQQYQNPLIRQSYKISFIFNLNLVTPPHPENYPKSEFPPPEHTAPCRPICLPYSYPSKSSPISFHCSGGKLIVWILKSLPWWLLPVSRT